ncbi:hypothetical protein NDU88_002378 [Pleurodeles waltl]|uniref:BED-type domain-containing protein n=1 Tax=Pleurodeles waltl TaxID=8319 RepID=A0AAV7R9V4_PLEWA|nr:hypothetical protein NDU88_002378 [Pleurodeles waltl]
MATAGRNADVLPHSQDAQDIDNVGNEDSAEEGPSTRKASVAWDFFTIISEEFKTLAKLVKCFLRDEMLSGCSNKKYLCGTTSMLYHLKTYHGNQLKRARKQRQAGTTATGSGTTLTPGETVPLEEDTQIEDIAAEFSRMAMYCMDWKNVVFAGEQSVKVLCDAAKQNKC